MKKIVLLLALTAFVWSGCTEKDVINETKNLTAKDGKVALKLSEEGSYKTKADPTVSVDDFKVVIKNSEDQVLFTWEKYSLMPEVVSLKPGTYTIEAGTAVIKAAAFDYPIYKGTQQFTVEPSKISNVNVVCKLANMKVTFDYSDTFLNELEEYTIVISTPEGGFLTLGPQESRAAYFTVAPLTIRVTGTRKIDGTEVSEVVTINSVAAQDHHIITFGAVEMGQGGFGIDIDYSTNDRNTTITVPGDDLEEDGPNPPPIPEESAPKITGPGLLTPLVFTDTEAQSDDNPPVVDIQITTGESGIAELYVDIESPYLTEQELANVGLPKKFDLANLPTPELEAIMRDDLHLIGTEPVKGKTNFVVSIGTFVRLLPHDTANNTGMDHKFIITVKDGDGNVSNATLVLRRIP